MRRRLIRAFLFLSRSFGLFALARRLTADRLRILCYHGFSMNDEVAFRASLFMTEPVFRQRMQFLADQQYPVLRLSQALAELERGTMPPCATAITIDDGFYSVHRIARDVLAEHGFPATLYVTSYYVEKQTPIYRLLISYILWKAPDGVVADLSGLGVQPIGGAGPVTLTPAEKGRLYEHLVAQGERMDGEDMRQSIARRLADAVGVDYQAIYRSRILSLINDEEARDLERTHIGIELHTHRHTFPVERAGAERELIDNRRVLEAAVHRRLKHFCYPSGDWAPAHAEMLRAMEVESATTCDSGLVVRGCNRYALPRILDAMAVSQVEFEAEMCGYLDLIRDARARLGGRRLAPQSSLAAAP